MSLISPPVPTVDGLVVRPMHRDEYFALAEHGYFDDEKIELLDGLVVTVSPESDPHALVIRELNWLLARSLPETGWRVSVGHPFLAGNWSVPEPDVAIIPKTDRVIHPDSAALIVEVAYSSRRRDLGRKAGIYAAADLPSYWVVDLKAEVTHVHTRPGADGYQDVEQVPFAATLTVMGIDVVIADLLSPPA